MKTFIIFAIAFSYAACSSTKKLSLEPRDEIKKDQIVDQFEVKPLEPKIEKEITAITPLEKIQNISVKESKKKKKQSVKNLATSISVATDAPILPSVFKIPNRRPKEIPFWVGEVQTLDITYLGMVAGQFELELLPPVSVQNRKSYHFEGRAKSSSLFNLVYSVNDKIETFMDFEGLFSHKFHMLLDQTKQKRDSLELYDHEKKQEYYWSRKDHVTKGFSEIKEYQPITPFTQDSFSAYHYLRTLPLETGKQYVIPVASEGRSWEAVATVVRREVISTSLGKRAAIVIKPQTRFQGVLKQGESDSYLWLSDDGRRFMLQFEAKVKIGSVIGAIKKIELGEKPVDTVDDSK